MLHRLLVCTTCASTWQGGKKVGVSGGETLWQELSLLYQNWDQRSQFEVQPVACMSACSQACVVTLTAAEKYTYLFGNLPSDVNQVTDTAKAILNCAEMYGDRQDGLLAWKDRPEPLKNGVIARLPPL